MTFYINRNKDDYRSTIYHPYNIRYKSYMTKFLLSINFLYSFFFR